MKFYTYNRKEILIFFIILFIPLYNTLTSGLVYFLYIFDCQLLNCTFSSLITLSYLRFYENTAFYLLINIFITFVFSLLATKIWNLFFKSKVLNKKILFGFVGLLILIKILNIVGLFFGFHLGFPPTRCDFVYGTELSGDMLYSKRDKCIRQLNREKEMKSTSKESLYSCLFVNKNSSYGRPDLDRWECVGNIYQKNNELKKCGTLPFDDVRGGCIKNYSDKEILKTGLLYSALETADLDLGGAIRKCKELSTQRNQKECFEKVSDKYSGITNENMFNENSTRATKMINLCTGNPDQDQWLACLWGSVFRKITGTDRLNSTFLNMIRSDPYKKDTFCKSFICTPGDYCKNEYWVVVGDFEKEVCK